MIKKMVLTGLCCALAGSMAFALPNPASVFCVKNGGVLKLLGYGRSICIFPADEKGQQSYCEEWAYFRGQCKPGLNPYPALPAVEPELF